MLCLTNTYDFTLIKDLTLILLSLATILVTVFFSSKNYKYQQNVLNLQESNLLLQQSNLEIQKENHHLQKSKENENELFKIKIEKYYHVFNLGFQIHQEVREILNYIKKALEKKEITEVEIYQLADELDKKIDIYYDAVLLDLAFLPKEIFTLYDAYFDKTYKDLYIDNFNQDEITTAFKILDEIELDFYKIMDKMREEIGYNTLNNKLRNRIRNHAQLKKFNKYSI